MLNLNKMDAVRFREGISHQRLLYPYRELCGTELLCVCLKLNLGVTLDYQMSFAATIAVTIRSSRFMLHNFLRMDGG